MKAIFLVCGLVAIAFVLVISIYLIVSGIPAIREVGLWNFLAGSTWDPRQQHHGRPLRHPAHDTHQHLRHLRRDNHRRAHRLPHGRLPLQGGKPQGGLRHTRGCRPPRRHPQRRLRFGRHDGAASRHPQHFQHRRRRQPAGRHHRAGHHDPAQHHLRERDRAQRRAARVRGGVPRPRRDRARDLFPRERPPPPRAASPPPSSSAWAVR